MDSWASKDRDKVLVNLTGHPLSVISNGRRKEIAVEGRARVDSKMTTEYRAHVRGGLVVPVLTVSEQTIVGLPGQIPGVLYITSGLVGSFVRDFEDRDDVVSPGRVVRSSHGGRVVGCEALVRLTR